MNEQLNKWIYKNMARQIDKKYSLIDRFINRDMFDK